MVTQILHRHFIKGLVAFDLPAADFIPPLREELEKCRKKNNDYVCVALSQPKTPRTTGKHSQNNHFWGHVTQIAHELGCDIADVEKEVKLRALPRGYGFHANYFTGEITPDSTTGTSTVEIGYAIDACHELAGEYGIILVESEIKDYGGVE